MILFFTAFTAGFQVGVYDVNEVVGVQRVCVSLSGELDGSNVILRVTSSSDGATAQGKFQPPVLDDCLQIAWKYYAPFA